MVAATAAESAVRTRALTKYYRRQRGIEDLDLEVSAGEVFGFLGPNGAGKTTTIRLLLGLLHPTSGTAELFGRDATREGTAIRRRVGYLPGDLELYENLNGHELLRFFARMRGDVPQSRIDDLASRLGLDLGRHVHDLSKGNRQKLGVVQAFMHEPDLLVLDEPTSGLDPVVQLEFQEMVREAAARGAAVFLSSHMLAEVEQLADRVGIVVDGRLAVVEHISTLKSKALRRLDLDFGRPVDASVFAGVPGVLTAAAHGDVVACTVSGHVTELLRTAVARGVLNVVSHEPDLSQIFFGYVGGGENHERVDDGDLRHRAVSQDVA
jgi:ABC-2 type transport system ATP-binding protein